MLKIIIPNNNIAERKYIIDIIFCEFLDLDYLLELGSNNYQIIFENKKILEIEDKFFNKYPKDLEYLRYENIPKNIKDLDMFSASFFMLTRWEEYVNIKRDKHNRFPATESLAYKQGFLRDGIFTGKWKYRSDDGSYSIGQYSNKISDIYLEYEPSGEWLFYNENN